MGDTVTSDFSALFEVMEPVKHYEFFELAQMSIEQGLFEHITSDGDQQSPSGLSKRAVRQLATILGKYHDRRFKSNYLFQVLGKGHARRFIKVSLT
jgi:hypothetical protein